MFKFASKHARDNMFELSYLKESLLIIDIMLRHEHLQLESSNNR